MLLAHCTACSGTARMGKACPCGNVRLEADKRAYTQLALTPDTYQYNPNVLITVEADSDKVEARDAQPGSGTDSEADNPETAGGQPTEMGGGLRRDNVAGKRNLRGT